MTPPTTHAGTRAVHCEDAIAWLQARGTIAQASFITSLPDFSEFPEWSLERWKSWFIDAAETVMVSCPDDGVAIFFQTDVKHEGTWVDKSLLCQKAAEKRDFALLWRKVVCRAPAGAVTFGKPAYSHLLCFSRGVRAELSRSLPDVLPEAGEKTWTRGMGAEACALACRFIREQTASRLIVDPFCGHGTVLAVANELGFDSIGIELGKKRAKIARNLVSSGLRLSRPGQTLVSGAHHGPNSASSLDSGVEPDA